MVQKLWERVHVGWYVGHHRSGIYYITDSHFLVVLKFLKVVGCKGGYLEFARPVICVVKLSTFVRWMTRSLWKGAAHCGQKRREPRCVSCVPFSFSSWLIFEDFERCTTPSSKVRTKVLMVIYPTGVISRIYLHLSTPLLWQTRLICDSYWNESFITSLFYVSHAEWFSATPPRAPHQLSLISVLSWYFL